MKLLITEDTWLKRAPLQSSTLPDSDKIKVNKGQTFDILRFTRTGDHVTTKTNLTVWLNDFVFTGHCKVEYDITPAVKLIKEFEGFSSLPYYCPSGVLTIGYGHTATVKAGMKVTEAQAEKLLAQDLKTFQTGLRNLIKVPLTDNSYSALLSLAYNIGLGAFANSTLLRKLNAQDYDGAANSFFMWTKGNGRILPGLVRRREAERVLFQS